MQIYREEHNGYTGSGEVIIGDVGEDVGVLGRSICAGHGPASTRSTTIPDV